MEKAVIKTIFWDFDGVIMNSNAIRDRGFLEVLKEYPTSEVDKLMNFHQQNGGLSRYVKFRYFFEEVRGEKITDQDINLWAQKFSEIMLKLLIDRSLLIEETLQFIKSNYQDFKMHIVSGSDQTELRKICEGIKIDKYFVSIHGSPTPKNTLVANLLDKHNYGKQSCILIGDSKNDHEAAEVNGVYFMGYGNDTIVRKTNYKLF
jgi:phosphoglycolate phosphatase-like HAD superfamily hydrolase